MDILFVAEKPSIMNLFKEIIDKYPEDFKDNYYFDYKDFVTHIGDNILRTRKFDGRYYINGNITNCEDLKLKNLDIPAETFLTEPFKASVKNNYKGIVFDKVISICDYDDYGILGFQKYLEDNNISSAEILIYNDLSENSLYKVLKENNLIDFSKIFNEVKEKLIKNNFQAPYPKVENIRFLRFECNMSRKDFAEYFGIPYRTLENWETDTAKCPKYLYDLIEYKLYNERIFIRK